MTQLSPKVREYLRSLPASVRREIVQEYNRLNAERLLGPKAGELS